MGIGLDPRPAPARAIRHVRTVRVDHCDLFREAIRTLLALQDNPNQPCTTADGVARARLADVEQRIRSLTALKAELELMIKGCKHGFVATCRVIEVLALSLIHI